MVVGPSGLVKVLSKMHEFVGATQVVKRIRGKVVTNKTVNIDKLREKWAWFSAI